MSAIRIDSDAGITRITLARPQVRNAFDEQLVAELGLAFARLPPATRVVVLAGDGPTFCAGADLAWMQRSIGYSETENTRDARQLLNMFQAIDSAPCVVIARVLGAALGGGAGLAACCDIAVAASEARFGFPEVRLGLVPGVISSFVIRRVGAARARRYFLTGESFSAEEARRIGLIDEVVAVEAIDSVIDGLAQAVLHAGPRAVESAKRLVQVIEASDSAFAAEHAVTTLAGLRVQPEAQEGMRAFLEKRTPRWL